MYTHLFSPLDLGKTQIPNRVVFLSHRTNLAESGRLNNRMLSYYKARAEGGCGMIVFGEVAIEENDLPYGKVLPGFTPAITQAYHELADTVHPYGTKVFAQLCHHGFQSGGAISRHVTIGPSATQDVNFGETCKAMEPEDFKTVLSAFAVSAEYAKEGGLDGVVIDMGPESILRQFLSNICNFRGDEYGGTPENRLRFPLEVIETVRQIVGKDFTVGVELVADEMLWDGVSPEVAADITRAICATNQIDFIISSVGSYYNLTQVQPTMHTPFGFSLEQTANLKAASTVPVIAAHHIESTGMAESIIAEGKADGVGVIRNLICDPDLPNKAREGQEDAIVVCARDNKGCVGRVGESKAISCIQNPYVGYEGDKPKSYEKTTASRNVLVIGGGPAGMEAAKTAALRGHSVVLVEKEEELGGQINIHQKAAGRDQIAIVKENLRTAIKKLDIKIKLGMAADEALIENENPDVVIFATGSEPKPRPVPGEYGPPYVQSVTDVLLEKHDIGEKVLFIDTNGNHHATATVEYLAEQGKKIDMVSCDLFIGIELGNLGDLSVSRSRLLQKGVTFITDIRITGIAERKVTGRKIYTNEEVTYADYDTVVLDMGNRAIDELYKVIKAKKPRYQVFRAGDCVAPRGIDMAIFEGRKIGEAV